MLMEVMEHMTEAGERIKELSEDDEKPSLQEMMNM